MHKVWDETICTNLFPIFDTKCTSSFSSFTSPFFQLNDSFTGCSGCLQTPSRRIKSSRVRVCLAIFHFLFLNSLRLFNFIHACVPLITPAIETGPSFFAVSFICVFRCEIFGPGDEASILLNKPCLSEQSQMCNFYNKSNTTNVRWHSCTGHDKYH